MAGTIVVDPFELEAAAGAVGERVELGNRAGAALAAVDLSCEMPPGVAGRVRGLVDGARGDLLASTAGVVGLSTDLLRRVGDAKRADQIGAAFGGLLGAAGMMAGKVKFADSRERRTWEQWRAGVDRNSKPKIFGASVPPRSVIAWANKLSRGAGWAGNIVSIGGIVAKTSANPYLTPGQKRSSIGTETATTVGKTVVMVGAGALIAAGAVLAAPAIGVAAAAAGTFVVATAAAMALGKGLDAADKALGITKHAKPIVHDATVKVGQALQEVERTGQRVEDAVEGAAKDVVGGIRGKLGI